MIDLATAIEAGPIVLSGRRYLRSSSEGAEIASTSSPVFFSFSLRAMSAWATMPTSLPFSTTGRLRTGGGGRWQDLLRNEVQQGQGGGVLAVRLHDDGL